jgi:hypothetical protein
MQGTLFSCHERKISIRGRCNICINVVLNFVFQGTCYMCVCVCVCVTAQEANAHPSVSSGRHFVVW